MVKGWIKPELCRVRGNYCRLHNEFDQMEAALSTALDDARAHDAKWWELRTATSLASLWCEQGKRSEAHDLLAPVYNWFTEGLDLPDLKDAKSLLETLS